MTAKDYIKIATAIKEARLIAWTDDRDMQFVVDNAIDAVVSNVALVLLADNARFDGVKFRQACEL